MHWLGRPWACRPNHSPNPGIFDPVAFFQLNRLGLRVNVLPGRNGPVTGARFFAVPQGRTAFYVDQYFPTKYLPSETVDGICFSNHVRDRIVNPVLHVDSVDKMEYKRYLQTTQ
jgi:hypothetical protein